MKVLLSILCGTVILFVGGCVMSLGSGGGPIAWASWGVVGVNLLMIIAMWGLSGPMRPLFIAMAVLDVAVALVIGGVTVSEAGSDKDLLFWGLVAALAFALKAGLSFAVAKRVRRDATLDAVEAPDKDTPPDV